MRKALMIIAIAVLVLVPVTAVALYTHSSAPAADRAYYRAEAVRPELTEQQQADLEASFNDMIAVRKESINTMLADGLITEEQAQIALERLDEMVAYHTENGVWYGYDGQFGCFDDEYFGYGRGMMRDYGRGGMMGGYGYYDWN
jgi:hypothetical protein